MDLNFTDVFFNDLSGSLAVEIVFRTLVMFTFLLAFLRLTGKKGIRQLSLFEVAIVIGLGSAAGDPMLSQEHGIIPALLVFSCILLLYRGITWLAANSERFERLVEGNPEYIIEDGEFVVQQIGRQAFAKDEFFSEMRQQSIEHVGQVKTALLETNGNVSFFYFENAEVKPGLPVLPKPYARRRKVLTEPGDFACTTCARVRRIDTGGCECPRCGEREWVEALRTSRLN